MTSYKIAKGILGKTFQLKQLVKLFHSMGWRLKNIGMEMIKEEDLNLSTDIELYHYVVFTKDGELMKVWFNVELRDLQSFMNFVVTITEVEAKKKIYRKD